ncbi:MAG TPA: hypothetical protein VGM41_14800 [Chitinophagaceae bacterium]
MSILDRMKSPTPAFFVKLRNIGLVLAAISGAVATTPVALPSAVVTIAGYVSVAAGVMSAISQTTVQHEA